MAISHDGPYKALLLSKQTFQHSNLLKNKTKFTFLKVTFNYNVILNKIEIKK